MSAEHFGVEDIGVDSFGSFGQYYGGSTGREQSLRFDVFQRNHEDREYEPFAACAKWYGGSEDTDGDDQPANETTYPTYSTPTQSTSSNEHHADASNRPALTLDTELPASNCAPLSAPVTDDLTTFGTGFHVLLQHPPFDFDTLTTPGTTPGSAQPLSLPLAEDKSTSVPPPANELHTIRLPTIPEEEGASVPQDEDTATESIPQLSKVTIPTTSTETTEIGANPSVIDKDSIGRRLEASAPFLGDATIADCASQDCDDTTNNQPAGSSKETSSEKGVQSKRARADDDEETEERATTTSKKAKTTFSTDDAAKAGPSSGFGELPSTNDHPKLTPLELMSLEEFEELESELQMGSQSFLEGPINTPPPHSQSSGHPPLAYPANLGNTYPTTYLGINPNLVGNPYAGLASVLVGVSFVPPPVGQDGANLPGSLSSHPAPAPAPFAMHPPPIRQPMGVRYGNPPAFSPSLPAPAPAPVAMPPPPPSIWGEGRGRGSNANANAIPAGGTSFSRGQGKKNTRTKAPKAKNNPTAAASSSSSRGRGKARNTTRNGTSTLGTQPSAPDFTIQQPLVWGSSETQFPPLPQRPVTPERQRTSQTYRTKFISPQKMSKNGKKASSYLPTPAAPPPPPPSN